MEAMSDQEEEATVVEQVSSDADSDHQEEDAVVAQVLDSPTPSAQSVPETCVKGSGDIDVVIAGTTVVNTVIKQEPKDINYDGMELTSGMVVCIKGNNYVIKVEKDNTVKAYLIKEGSTKPGTASEILKKIIAQAGAAQRKADEANMQKAQNPTTLLRQIMAEPPLNLDRNKALAKGSFHEEQWRSPLKDKRRERRSKTVYVDEQGLFYNDPKGEELFVDSALYEDPETGQMFLDKNLSVSVKVHQVGDPPEEGTESTPFVSHEQTLFIIAYVKQMLNLEVQPANDVEEIEQRLRGFQGSKRKFFEDLTFQVNDSFNTDLPTYRIVRKWNTLIEAIKRIRDTRRMNKNKFRYYTEMADLMGVRPNRGTNSPPQKRRMMTASGTESAAVNESSTGGVTDFHISVLEQMKQTNQTIAKFFEVLPVLLTMNRK